MLQGKRDRWFDPHSSTYIRAKHDSPAFPLVLELVRELKKIGCPVDKATVFGPHLILNSHTPESGGFVRTRVPMSRVAFFTAKHFAPIVKAKIEDEHERERAIRARFYGELA